jgi:hypothetical protein
VPIWEKCIVIVIVMKTHKKIEILFTIVKMDRKEEIAGFLCQVLPPNLAGLVSGFASPICSQCEDDNPIMSPSHERFDKDNLADCTHCNMTVCMDCSHSHERHSPPGGASFPCSVFCNNCPEQLP